MVTVALANVEEYMADVGSLMVDVAIALNVENYNVVQNNGMQSTFVVHYLHSRR